MFCRVQTCQCEGQNRTEGKEEIVLLVATVANTSEISALKGTKFNYIHLRSYMQQQLFDVLTATTAL